MMRNQGANIIFLWYFLKVIRFILCFTGMFSVVFSHGMFSAEGCILFSCFCLRYFLPLQVIRAMPRGVAVITFYL